MRPLYGAMALGTVVSSGVLLAVILYFVSSATVISMESSDVTVYLLVRTSLCCVCVRVYVTDLRLNVSLHIQRHRQARYSLDWFVIAHCTLVCAICGNNIVHVWLLAFFQQRLFSSHNIKTRVSHVFLFNIRVYPFSLIKGRV